MKNLSDYILESSVMKYFDVIVDHIDLTDIDVTDYNTVFKLIKEGITESKSRFQILRAEAVENYNKKYKEYTENALLKALPEEINKIVDHVKGLKSLMKRSEAYHQKYLNDKLEKFKTEFTQNKYKYLEKIIKFDENKASFYWYDNIFSNNECVSYKCEYYTDEQIAKKVTDYIVGCVKNKDEYWSNITAINIALEEKDLHDKQYVIFNIVPMFDKETEEKLDKKIRSFERAISREYDSGRYMGD